jgi:endonuclease YncB( thermonuclease family)
MFRLFFILFISILFIVVKLKYKWRETVCKMLNLMKRLCGDRESNYLQEIEYKNTEKFIPNIKFGKVIKVYDGDTITIASRLSPISSSPISSSPIYRFSVRIRNIDSAEIKGSTAHEKIQALQAREELHKLVFGKIVYLRDVDTEKYGRILADVILCSDDKSYEINVGNWMLEHKVAVPYDGGKKMRPSEWD